MNLDGSGWGPTITGGRGRLRRIGLYAAVATVLTALAFGIALFSLYRIAEGNLQRVEMSGLAQKDQGPMNVLVVGSDSRDGMSDDEIARLRLGRFEGGRSDAVFLVSISGDREHAAVVSFPRDLLVEDDGVRRKLSETFYDGPSHVVEVIQETTDVPIHHYVEVAIPGFLNAVDALGSVEICLDEPLRDRKSNSDFDAGCHEMGPEEALAYVRARQTARGDFDRMERHQRFVRATLERMVATRTLVDLPKLFGVVDRVSRNVRTDGDLDTAEMRRLAQEVRGLVEDEVPMTVVPSYAFETGDGSYVAAYAPGARALFGTIRAGQPVPSRGSRDERSETQVEVWSGGQEEHAEEATETLFWSQFLAYRGGRGELEPPLTTAYYTPGAEEQAGWVAAVLGVPVRPLPEHVEVAEGVEVVVQIGTGDIPSSWFR